MEKNCTNQSQSERFTISITPDNPVMKLIMGLTDELDTNKGEIISKTGLVNQDRVNAFGRVTQSCIPFTRYPMVTRDEWTNLSPDEQNKAHMHRTRDLINQVVNVLNGGLPTYEKTLETMFRKWRHDNNVDILFQDEYIDNIGVCVHERRSKRVIEIIIHCIKATELVIGY